MIFARGQDCMKIEDYISTIDTSDRQICLFAEVMPEIMTSNKIISQLSFNKNLMDSLQCCPLYVNLYFVVEIDSTLSNINVCSKMTFCNDSVINSESEMFNKKIKQILSKTKSAPGKHNGEDVAIPVITPIHYECFDWIVD